jgi:hypothetical protein
MYDGAYVSRMACRNNAKADAERKDKGRAASLVREPPNRVSEQTELGGYR